MPTPFQLWVANAIAECGGNPIAYFDACNRPNQTCFYSPSFTFMDGMPSFLTDEGCNQRAKAIHSAREVCQSISDDFQFRCELAQCAYPLVCGVSAH